MSIVNVREKRIERLKNDFEPKGILRVKKDIPTFEGYVEEGTYIEEVTVTKVELDGEIQLKLKEYNTKKTASVCLSNFKFNDYFEEETNLTNLRDQLDSKTKKANFKVQALIAILAAMYCVIIPSALCICFDMFGIKALTENPMGTAVSYAFISVITGAIIFVIGGRAIFRRYKKSIQSIVGELKNKYKLQVDDYGCYKSKN